jgi:hypothetical protein
MKSLESAGESLLVSNTLWSKPLQAKSSTAQLSIDFQKPESVCNLLV